MGKDLSIKQKKIKDDAAIERGRAMYEEWEAKKLPSRKIVSYAEAALWSMKRTKTWEKRINAIVYLFALDMRIRERYKSIKSLILFFFSRRREMRVFRRLLDALGMSVGKKGLRSAIEIELERIREKIKKMEADDDDTKGGKRTQKSDEKSEEREIGEQADTAEKSEENVAEEKSEELSEGEEARETEDKKAEADASESEAGETVAEENGENKVSEKLEENSLEASLKEDTEISANEEIGTKEENNGDVEKTKSGTDKNNDISAYNDAFDPTELFGSNEKSESEPDKLSFIDELMMDDIARGKYSFHSDGKSDGHDKDTLSNAEARENTGEDQVKNEKDRYLYDKSALKENSPETDKTVTAENQPQTNQQETNQTQTTQAEPTQIQTNQAQTSPSQTSQPQTNQSLGTNAQGFEDAKAQLEVDMAAQAEENKARGSIGENMPEEELQQFYDMQASVMREQLKILSDEVGMEAPVEIIGLADEVPQKSIGAELNRK